MTKKELEDLEELAKLSRANVSFTGNSKGINIHVSVYEGADEKLIDTVVENAAYAFRAAQQESGKFKWVTAD